LSVQKALAGLSVIVLLAVLQVSGLTPATAALGDPPAPAAPRRAPRWPAPPPDRVVELTTAAGLVPETAESLQYHVHAHLDVFINGRHQTVPAGIGIVTTDPAVHTGTISGQPAYGGITVPCAQPCISPLHTHAVTGIIHTESPTRVDNTLGQFFIEWDVPLTPQCVDKYCTPDTRIAIYVNGRRQSLAGAARHASRQPPTSPRTEPRLHPSPPNPLPRRPPPDRKDAAREASSAIHAQAFRVERGRWSRRRARVFADPQEQT
jgi:hypothetical protein